MKKKRMIKFSCLLVISLCVSVVVLSNWLQATTRCQMPFLPFAPSPMPKTISGFLARVEGIREWNRSVPHWWKAFNDFPLANHGSAHSVTEIAVRGDDIWAIYNHFPSIERYNLATGSHAVYHMIGGKEIQYTQHLLIGRNGEVWVTANLGKSFALARFDRTADTFKAVEGNDIYSALENKYSSNWGSALMETLDGNLLIPFQKNIYLYV